jgi:hypothetical protein
MINLETNVLDFEKELEKFIEYLDKHGLVDVKNEYDYVLREWYKYLKQDLEEIINDGRNCNS